jgi:Archaeal fructose-1,6-bisphosphatase and related enzymes of inositol monophosphatase family
VALVKGEDILLGVTYDPVRGELFRTEKGQGAYLNASPIKVSKEGSLKASMVSLDLGYSQQCGSEVLDVASKLWWHVHSLRIMGSGSLGLAYVACGRLGLYFHRYIFPWDIASGILMIREAGGEVTDWQGKPAGFRATEIIASNHLLHREFLARFGQGQASK